VECAEYPCPLTHAYGGAGGRWRRWGFCLFVLEAGTEEVKRGVGMGMGIGGSWGGEGRESGISYIFEGGKMGWCL
jgi:hypothetical protein